MRGWENAHLKPANQVIRNVVLEEFAPLVVLAAPAPHVLAIASLSALVENAGADAPHDNAEDEERDGKGGIVHSYLFSTSVATSPPRIKDAQGHEERDASNDKNGNLWPDGRVFGPWRKVVAWRNGLGCIEDVEHCRHHCQNNKTAAEVDAAQKDLGRSHTNLCFLYEKYCQRT